MLRVRVARFCFWHGVHTLSLDMCMRIRRMLDLEGIVGRRGTSCHFRFFLFHPVCPCTTSRVHTHTPTHGLFHDYMHLHEGCLSLIINHYSRVPTMHHDVDSVSGVVPTQDSESSKLRVRIRLQFLA